MPTQRNFVERTDCPACRGKAGKTLYRSPFDQGPIGSFVRAYYGVDPAILAAAPYELVRCLKCTLVYQKWVGDGALLAELYGDWINEANLPADDPQYQQEVSHPLESRDGHEIMAAASLLGVAPSAMTTMDYGMGWAMWARIAKHLGAASYGSEISPTRIDFARQHGVIPLADHELGADRFHFVNTEQVMEHVADPRGIAERLAKALVPGGILKISVPSAERADRIAESLRSGRCRGTIEELMPVQPLEHINSFTRKSIEVLAASLGLEVAHIPLGAGYAFLGRPGSISPRRPKKALKELVRPFYQVWNPRNLYVWLRKPVARG
jgi:hypothetical protein